MNEPLKITAVIPLRQSIGRAYMGQTKPFLNIKHSIDSILYQSVIDEVIIVNNTPAKQEVEDEQIEYIEQQYLGCDKLKIVNIDYNGCFNRSWLLNIGIKKANSEIFLATDVDIILAPDFSSHINNVDFDKNFYTLKCFGYVEDKINWVEFSYIEDFSTYMEKLSHRYGNGILLCKTKHLLDINGYDERFQVWGCEDDDIINRLKESGMLFSDKHLSSYIHQPHTCVGEAYLSKHELATMKESYKFLSDKTVIKNKDGWGDVSCPNLGKNK